MRRNHFNILYLIINFPKANIIFFTHTNKGF
jgi:hypothetical protein